MSETTSSTGVGSAIPRQSSRPEPEPTGWVGLVIFAGTMMVLVGTFHVIQGLVALFDDGYYLVAKSGLTVHVDYTAWGWTHLIAGIVAIFAGVGLFSGKTWARAVGVIMALVSAIVSFGFIAAYPFWSVTIIALDVFVLYALTAHGREMQTL